MPAAKPTTQELIARLQKGGVTMGRIATLVTGFHQQIAVLVDEAFDLAVLAEARRTTLTEREERGEDIPPEDWVEVSELFIQHMELMDRARALVAAEGERLDDLLAQQED